MARIFLALTLEKDVNDQIIDIKKELKSNPLKNVNITWQRNDYHHLTVYFVGEMEPEQITQMSDGLDNISLTDFSRSIELIAISSFPNDDSQAISALVKPSPQLQTLYEEVEKIIVNIGLGSDLKTYRPHITLGRFKEKNRPRYEFKKFKEPMKGKVAQLNVLESEFISKGKTEYKLLKSLELK